MFKSTIKVKLAEKFRCNGKIFGWVTFG